MFKGKGELGKFESNKVTFLNDNYDNEASQITLYRIFKMFSEIEEIKDKDLALFTREEILDIVSSIPTYSTRTQNMLKSCLTAYMDWAIQRGVNPTMVNSMDTISSELFEDSINKKVLSSKFITKEELMNMRNFIEKNKDIVINAQEILLLILPFYSIYGNDCSEMRNLKPSDIDFDNKIITVVNKDGEYRKVKGDDYLLEILKEAIEEEEFIRDNGWKEYLKPNGYVLKTTRSSKQISSPGIRQRIQKIVSIYNSIADRQIRVTLKSLVSSGKYHRLEQIKKEKGKLTNQDFQNVMTEFGDNPNSYFGLKKDYLLAIDKVD